MVAAMVHVEEIGQMFLSTAEVERSVLGKVA